MTETIIKSFDVWTAAQGVKSRGRVKSIDNISLEGIARLRELILELAIRGKLVPQDSGDEPASELTNKLVREKAQLKEEGNFKNHKPLPSIAENEKPFQIRANWHWIRLGEIGTTNIGLTYAPKNVTTKGTFVLRSSNIQNGEIDLSDSVRVDLDVRDNVLAKQGDLLICARNGSRSLVGKCALIRELPEPMAFGAFMAIYRSSVNEYIKIFLESPLYRKNLEGVTTTTINQITQDNLKSTIVPLPPLQEQQRIIAKVDELMALCDKLEQEQTASLKTHQTLVQALLQTLTDAKDADAVAAAWQRLSPHFDTLFCTEDSIEQLKQTILQLAVMGRLVPQDPDDEPASELIKRIEKEKAELVKAGRLKKEKALPLINDEEMPFGLPKGWEWARLGRVAIKITDGTHHSPPNSEEGKYLYVTAKNIKEGGISLVDITFVSEEVHNEIYARCNPEYGDLLYIKDGATTGVVTLNNIREPFSMLSSVALIKLPKEALNTYLLLALRSPFYFQSTRQDMTGVAITRVTLSKMILSTIPLPPLSEQHRIVAKVDELIALCDTLKARMFKAEEVKVKLSQTIIENTIA